jgi:hypothetical protein
MHDHDPVVRSRPAAGGPVGRSRDDIERPHAAHSMWWMVVCCAPMVLVALAIILGVFGPR